MPDLCYPVISDMKSLRFKKLLNHQKLSLDEVWDNYIEQGGRADKVKAVIINYPNNLFTISFSFAHITASVYQKPKPISENGLSYVL